MDKDLESLLTRKARKHGCQLPLSIHFIFSWIFVLGSGPFYYILYDPFLSVLSTRVPITLILSILWSLLIISAIILIFSDPADKRIYLKTNSTIETRYCLVCKANVHMDSLHCKYCNKCVYRLDHHCFYVNNCIARSNYKIYITSMILLCAFSFMNFCTSVYVFSTYFTDSTFFMKIRNFSTLILLETVYNLSIPAILSLCILFTTFTCIVWTYISYLLHFHWILNVKGMTSIEYSRWQRSEKKDSMFVH